MDESFDGAGHDMNEDQMNEVLSWIRDDRLKLAVLESQMKEMKEAHKEVLAELRALPERIRKDVAEVVSTCRAMQDAKRGKGESGKDESDTTAIAAIWKYLGAAIGGAGLTLAALFEWIKNGGNPH